MLSYLPVPYVANAIETRVPAQMGQVYVTVSIMWGRVLALPLSGVTHEEITNIAIAYAKENPGNNITHKVYDDPEFAYT